MWKLFIFSLKAILGMFALILCAVCVIAFIGLLVIKAWAFAFCAFVLVVVSHMTLCFCWDI